MSAADANAVVERVLALTREMQTAAHARDWETLARLQTERQPLLEAHCTRDQVSEAVLQHLHECNERIVTSVLGARDQLTAEWQDARAGHRAAQDYGRVARDGGG